MGSDKRKRKIAFKTGSVQKSLIKDLIPKNDMDTRPKLPRVGGRSRDATCLSVKITNMTRVISLLEEIPGEKSPRDRRFFFV